MNYKDLVKNVRAFINRKRSKQEPEAVKEFAGDGRDHNPGKVSMNGGEHGTVFGINRKVITAIGVGIVLVVGMATIFNLTEKPKGKDQGQQTQETAANADGILKNDKNAVPSYDQLLERNKQSGKSGKGNNSGKAEQNGQPGNVPAMPRASVPTLPASFSAPPALPSQAVAQQSAEDRAAARAQKEEEDRFKSVIEFALNRSANNNTESHNGNQTGSGMQAGAIGGSPADSGLVQVSYTAPSDNILQAGTVIPAMLFSGINTDTPGQLTAEVQADVYDSATGTRLLIPAGSTLVGSCEQGNAASTGRVGLVFSTLVLSDGGSFNLGDSFVAMDSNGYNGLKGKVNHHTGSKIGGGAFASALAALGSYATGNVSTQDTYTGGQLAMQGAMANLMQTASTLFKKGADKQNTVTIAPGQQFFIFVTKPVSFGI